MKALIVVDMLNDFAAGDAGKAVQTIVPAIRRLIDHARADVDWLTVYANDAHRFDDREIAVRGRHALAGTHGAAVIDPLAPIGAEREFVISKRFYGAFEGSDLEDVLYDYDVTDVVVVGVDLHGAVRHTVYGAFLSDFEITVPVDAVCTPAGRDHDAALGDLDEMYGATLATSAALIGRPVLRTAVSNPARGPK